MYLGQIPSSVRPPRKAPPGYVWEFVPDDSGLSGLGKFKLKKAFKKIGKIAKKALPIAAGIMVGGPLLAQGAMAVKGMLSRGASPTDAGEAAMQTVGPPAQAAGMPPAQVQALINQAYQTGAQQAGTLMQPHSAGPTMYRDAPPSPAPAQSAMPNWLLPAAIGAGALLIALK